MMKFSLKMCMDMDWIKLAVNRASNVILWK